MLFQSSEIRWWSDQKNKLWDIYALLPGKSIQEPGRTDFYLKTTSIQTGVKIREGNHELKVKSNNDEQLDYGVMEHWNKWSHSAEQNILNTINRELLNDWIAVRKNRYKKSYEVSTNGRLSAIEGEWVEEGCGVEFTEVIFPDFEKTVFTLGLEAFSSSGNQRKNLMAVLEDWSIDYSVLSGLNSFGYPEFLSSLIKNAL
jgi:hypothetical protein